ncbi:MAG: extracellular solute-binding protein [Lachnospiraceae bacterium]|nr:extracellular solute-binding protein [Lachnospiraceae bacterium]
MTGKRKSGKIRLTILMAALSLSLLSLTGCHGSKGRAEFEVPKELDESRTFEITFWAKNDTNKTQTEIYQEAVRRFEEYYPNIHVNVRLYTNYGDIYNDVITNIATETTPNVCITYPDHIATYLTGSNTVVPLDSLFEDSRYGLGGKKVAFESVKREEIVPEFLEECTIGENIYAIPFMRSTEACYVNQTYVEKLGYELPDVLTWDFVWEVSEAAMKKDAKGNFVVNGQNVMIPFIYKSTDNMMIQMLRQKDWGYSDESGEIQIFNDQTASLLKTIAEHGKTKAFSTFKISSYPANFLNAGQCIFAVDSTAGATWMGSEAPLMDISADKVVSFKTAVRMVPQFDPEHPQMISQGPSVCVFNKADPQEVLASWLFAQYLLTDDVQIAYSGTEGYVPVTLKARNTQEYQDYLAKEGQDRKEHYDVKIKATKLLLENTQHTFVTPVFNGSASLRDAAGQLIENVVKSVRRKQTVDDKFIEKLYQDVISLYRLDQIGGTTETKKDLGPLPVTAKLLLGTLALVWICIIAVSVARMLKNKAKDAKKNAK